MKIDFKTGTVYYPTEEQQFKDSLEDLKIKDDEINEEQPTFTKTIHAGLPYARFKYLFFCLCMVLDGMIGMISLGQTQSIMANKFLLSKWIYKGE